MHKGILVKRDIQYERSGKFIRLNDQHEEEEIQY